LGLAIVLAGCGGHEYSASDVQRAFAHEGIRLARQPGLERRIRQSLDSRGAQIGAFLGDEAVAPDAVLDGPDGSDELYVGVFPHPVPLRVLLGGESALRATTRVARIYERRNVVAIGGADPRIRRALARLR
jgi:hypothetical protein